MTGKMIRRLVPLLALLGTLAPPAAAQPSSREVSFEVQNRNRSKVMCFSDRANYTVRGHIVTPPGGARRVVLFLHGLAWGEFLWNFDAVPGYNWAQELAGKGVASVVIDRLGYGKSDKPPGMQSCIGAQADVAHQIVEQLRSGKYGGPKFEGVALAGHSAAGAIAQVEAYSFDDIDALLVLAWADQGFSQQAMQAFGQSGEVCLKGGDPPGYARFGQSDEDFQALGFHDADPAVVEAATALRNPDPCGDFGSVLTAVLNDHRWVRTIKVPVLLVYGGSDAIFPPPAGDQQKGHFTGSDDVTLETIPETGHALSLERSAGTTRDVIASWLCNHSFC
jgi:pimeloyl-ACP methyl ester carboxylesterase